MLKGFIYVEGKMKEKIATSEWKVMEVLWEKPGAFATEVIEMVQVKEWSDKTVKTLLNRLVKKNLVSYQKEGKAYRYFPTVEKNACVQKESKEFLEKVFGGSSAAFLTAFIKNHKLSKEEIEELHNILDDKKS